MEANKYSVKFTPKAVDDLDEIYSYISSELFAEEAANNILERIEEALLSSENIRRYIEKFILNITIAFDNGDIGVSKYINKLDDLIVYLKFKNLVNEKIKINIFALYVVIEKMKHSLYIKDFKRKLNITGKESEEKIIKAYIDYFGNKSKDKINLAIISILLKKDKNYILKAITDYKTKLEKEHKVKKIEEDLFGDSNNYSIEVVDNLNGYEFEDFLTELFEGFGYEVEQTGYSGDFGADLIISNGMGKIAIQAKNYTGNVGNEAVQQILAAKDYYECDGAAVITNSYYTRQAIELANTTGVIMLNRDDLKDILEKGKLSFIQLCSI